MYVLGQIAGLGTSDLLRVQAPGAYLLFLSGLHSNVLREQFAQMMRYDLNVGAAYNNSYVLHVHVFLPVHVSVQVHVDVFV
jgi:hypothetical protein